MRTLNEAEKQKVLETISPLLRKRQSDAACVYGSQVSGYFREDSDYDVILVLSKFLQRIKYYYINGEVKCSVLAVDSRSFEGDCNKSSLGEFLAGRLLNPFEALWNYDFVRKAEVAFKRRVILEGLEIAYAENGNFTEELEIDLSYFLFEKLRRRAALYPPVVFSYSQTYGERLFSTNRTAALDGFIAAARQLASEGMIEFVESNRTVRVKPGTFEKRTGARLGVTATYTVRGIRQYAVHGYAGRVGLDVVGREVVSKISRSRNRAKLPDCIRYPKLFWRLPGSTLFAETTDWIGDLLDLFELKREETTVTDAPLGELASTAKYFTFQSKERAVSFAAKRYNDVKGMKWGLLNLWTLKNANFSVGALERLHREYHAIFELRRFGIATPKAIAVFLSERMLITDFVKGKDLSKAEADYLNERVDDLSPFTEFGKTLALLHKNGLCMGDSKPSNVVLSDSDKKIYLTDLEQAHRNGNPIWDVAEFIYYSIRFTMKEVKARKLVEAFIDGYKQAKGSPEIIKGAAGLRYRAPFQAFISPNVLTGVLKELREK